MENEIKASQADILNKVEANMNKLSDSNQQIKEVEN